MESIEKGPRFNIQKLLEGVGFTDVEKIELDEAYFTRAKEKLPPEVYTSIIENYRSVDVHRYTYQSDGLKVAGYLWTPKSMNHALPLVVWNRGGTGKWGSTGEKPGTAYASIACDLANHSAVVIGSDYRGGIGSEGHDEHGGADLDDVIALKEVANTLPFVSSKDAIVAGESRGGMMSYLLAAKMPWVKGIISLNGTTDLIESAAKQPDMVETYHDSFGGSDEELKKRSAVHFYQSIPKNLPILILQGGKDERVSVGQVRTLHALLKESGHMVEYHEFPEGGHGFYYGEPDREEIKSIIEHFMQEHLH